MDLDVNPENPNEFYVAYASGGLWHTTNNGTTFTPIFDHEETMTIGDIAVDWTHGRRIWVGTGEANSSRSSYAGKGVFLSIDGGKSWKNTGLPESHHIGRILLHPSTPNTAWVAALGHLFTHNKERGIYKTTDGGITWRQVLYISDSTSVVDLATDPQNPDVLYAASWERTRLPWHFDGEGKSSAIYKSENGGESWNCITKSGSGFPNHEQVGRIGIAVAPTNSNKLYAVVDNHERRKDDKKNKPKLDKTKLLSMPKADFMLLSAEELNEYLDYYDFPDKYDAAGVKEKVKTGEIQPADLVEFLEDADSDLFDTEIVGGEVYVSENAGTTWKKTNEQYLDNFYYTFGYYFGQIRVSPFDENEVYLLGVPVLHSKDGGKHFETLSKEHTHPDHHALWLNPKQRGHLLLGNDGGLDLSYDNGKSFVKLNRVPVGQFYAVNTDHQKPYQVYGGLQDNGVWVGSSENTPDLEWTATGVYPFKEIMGGDGMQIMIDKRDNKTVYTGYQFGNYAQLYEGEYRAEVKPQHELGEKPYRFNWQSPILLSPHSNEILYFGANRLFRSLDKGKTLSPISPDLTLGGKKGNVPFGTLTCISESPLCFGALYVGSDDGQLHHSPDGGLTWKNIGEKLPQGYWIRRVVASKHKENRVYVVLNGHVLDDFRPLVFVSENKGESWEQIAQNLPQACVNVLREDPDDEKLLYVGTDRGVHVSWNGGKTFQNLNNAELPNVAVHDLAVQAEAKELVIGTHGRSLYITDISLLQRLTDSIRQLDFYAFAPDSLKHNSNWGMRGYDWKISNKPKLNLAFWKYERGEIKLRIYTEKSRFLLYEKTHTAEKGLQALDYDLSMKTEMLEKVRSEIVQEDLRKNWKIADDGKLYLPPGAYSMEWECAGKTYKNRLKIRAPKARAKRGSKKTP